MKRPYKLCRYALLLLLLLASGCSKFNWKNENVYEIQNNNKNDAYSLKPAHFSPPVHDPVLPTHAPALTPRAFTPNASLQTPLPPLNELSAPSNDAPPPRQKQTHDKTPPPTPSCIHLNTSNKTQLMSLPGIGEKRADEIIQKRSQRPFKKKTDITKIKGIGKKTYNKMAPMLCDI